MNVKKRGPNLEKYLSDSKCRFVNYEQGAKIYKLPYWSFVRVAKEANANYPIRKTCIVDLDILEEFLKYHPEIVERMKKTRRSVNAKKKKDVPQVEKQTRDRRKKFVRYDEGAQLYSMGLHTFQDLAKDAKAVYRVKRIVLVNLDIFEEYLEAFRDYE